MELIGLIRNFKTHEMERKVREETTPQKKAFAFKSTLTISHEEVDDQEDNEDLFIVKNMKRMYNNAKFNNRKRWQGKEKRR